MTKLKLGAVALVMAGGLVVFSIGSQPMRHVRGEETTVTRSLMIEAPESKPIPDGPIDPKPWDTSASITVKFADRWEFGSGTIIRSTPDEAIIVTTATLFDDPEMRLTPPEPKDFRNPISVALYGQSPDEDGRPHVVVVEDALTGEVIDYDGTNPLGLALIRIRPGRRVAPASPLIMSDRVIEANQKMLTMAFPVRGEPILQPVEVAGLAIEDGYNGRSRLKNIPMVICRYSPDGTRHGRRGDGLFSSEGELAGVLIRGNERPNTGTFVATEAIREILQRNGVTTPAMTSSIEKPVPARAHEPRPPLAPEPQTASTSQEKRLDELERKLDRIIEALKIDSLRDVKGDFDGPPQRKLKTRPR